MSKLATTSTGEVQRAAKPAATLVGLLEQLKPEMARALPKHLNGDRMARLALTALRTTRDLAACTPESFAASIMGCAALGLEPNTQLGLAYLIPRRNHGKLECTMQIGYQGQLDLARRSGMVASIQAFPVFSGDDFRYSFGINPTLHHVPCGEDDPSKLTHCYAVCRLKDPGSDPVFVVLNRKQIDKRRDRGGAGSSSFSPWKTDYVAMAQKSAVRALFAWMPRSAEMATAVAVETAQETGRSVIAELPEQAAAALLGAGIQDITEDGEIVDAECDDPAERMREPGED